MSQRVFTEITTAGRRSLACAVALLTVSLMLGGCGGGGSSSSSSPHSEASSVPGFSFVQHPIPGAFGAAVVAYPTPPYLLGTANDGIGNLTFLDIQKTGLYPVVAYPRAPYDTRVADFNGDGIPDFISSVYSPTNGGSWAYLFAGNAAGVFTQDTTFGMQYVTADGAGFRGRTENILVADFNNDGTVDIFLPTYTYLDSHYDLSGDPTYERPGPPPNVNNALQSFLLLNDGTGKFVERAVVAGVSMHSTLSGITPVSTDPNGNQPEGTQAVDFNMDGLIDFYAGGHMFINQGVDDQGVPHFKDMAAAWGLTSAVLHSAPPWAPDATLPDNYLVTDEGAKFLDWNNDGRLDLLLFRWDLGSAHGARLFEFTGTSFVERTQALTTATATCTHPPPTPPPPADNPFYNPSVSPTAAFFSSPKPTGFNGAAAGINAYDLDNDGLEDVLVSGDRNGPVIFRNTGCGFTEVSAGDLDGVPPTVGSMGLADLDHDGLVDVIYPYGGGVAYYDNTTPPRGHSFTVEVLGPNGEHNQFGRVIQVMPPGTRQIYTRVVDSGSGYLSQNQYPILVGTPFSGAHTVKVYFAPLTKCVYGGSPCHATVLSFSIAPGQRALAYAPSAAHLSGYAVIASGN
jgi:FG-GAP-like repeat